MPTLKICPLDNAPIPAYATEGSAAFDLSASQETMLAPGATTIVWTGLKVEVPPHWQLNIYSRSGLAARGIFVANSPGIVDSDYRGEIGVILLNTTMVPHLINIGDRIAQAQLNPAHPVDFHLITEDQLTNTVRGNGGLGSTGR